MKIDGHRDEDQHNFTSSYGFSGGFCVQGLDMNIIELGSPTCPNWKNSHNYSWFVDLFLFLLAIWITRPKPMRQSIRITGKGESTSLINDEDEGAPKEQKGPDSLLLLSESSKLAGTLKSSETKEEELKNNPNLMTSRSPIVWSNALLIIFHGALHLMLSNILHCVVPDTSMIRSPDDINGMSSGEMMVIYIIGYLSYVFFTFALCAVILSLSTKLTTWGWKGPVILSAIATIITLRIAITDPPLDFLCRIEAFEPGSIPYNQFCNKKQTIDDNHSQIVTTSGSLVLPALFAISHLMSSVVGIMSTMSSQPQSIGDVVFHSVGLAWWFVIATFMGILELTECDNIIRPLGGHAIYDFSLHVGVLYAIQALHTEHNNTTIKELNAGSRESGK